MSPFGVLAQQSGEKKTELNRSLTDGTWARMSLIPHKTRISLNSFNLLVGSISLPNKDYPHSKVYFFDVYLLNPEENQQLLLI